MKVCIVGSGLSALTLAKALVNQNISVDMFVKKKMILLIYQELWEFLRVMLSSLIII